MAITLVTKNTLSYGLVPQQAQDFIRTNNYLIESEKKNEKTTSTESEYSVFFFIKVLSVGMCSWTDNCKDGRYVTMATCQQHALNGKAFRYV